jgi:hypothetical protein
VFSLGSVPKIYIMRTNGTSQSRKTREVENSESAVSSWEADPSDVIADGHPLVEAWEADEPHYC